MTISKLTDFQPLPEAVIGEIFSNLELEELAVVKHVSKKVNALAKAAVTTAVQKQKNNFKLNLSLGDAFGTLNMADNIDQAIEIARQFPSKWLKDRSLYECAKCLIKQGNLDKAFEIVKEVPSVHYKEELIKQIAAKLKSLGQLDKAAEVEKGLPVYD